MREMETSYRNYIPFAIISIVFLAILHVRIYLSADGTVADRFLHDTDTYMWLSRVLHLAGEGTWWDHVFPRINPPEGHQQHWTRPMDALLLAGATVLGWVIGFRDGLYFFGLALAPLFHAAALGALLWVVRPLVSGGLLPANRVPLVLLVFLVQIPIYQPFFAGRPDHHAPLAFLFVIHLGLWLRLMLVREGGAKTGMALGGVNALALWINPEAIIYVAICMASLLGLWVLSGDRELARRNARYGIALAAGVAGALLLEWGPAALQERQMDVLTYPHLVLMTLVAGFWVLLDQLTGSTIVRRTRGRAGIGAAASLGLIAVVLSIFPEFVSDPWGNTEPVYRETHLDRIGELQPLWSLGTGFLGNLGFLVLFAGTAVAAIGFLAWRIRRRGSVRERVVLLTFLALTSVYLILALRQARWSDYMAISAVIPFTLLVVALMTRRSSESTSLRVRVTRSATLLGVAAGPVFIGLTLMALSPDAEPSSRALEIEAAWAEAARDEATWTETIPASGEFDQDRSCDLVRVAEVLNDPASFPEAEVVMAHADHGPELLFRTHHSVLSITNHRPQPGYLLTREVLDNPDPDEAEALLLQSSTGVLLLCLRDVTTGFFGGAAGEEMYVYELVRGRIPAGFELHADDPGFRIYRRSPSPEIDLSQHFADIEGTFVLLDVQTGRSMRHNPERARTPFVPASTFKIANTLIALETGVADGADFPLSRDPSLAPREDWWPAVWAEDHVLRSAFPSSVVWYYQELARRIGEERMRAWLVELDFGNADVSGGIDQFWLTGGLAISPDEQVEFLRRLHSGELDVDPEHVDLVKELLVLEETPDYRLSGKTGWAGLGDPGEPQIGWLVGSLERGPDLYIYAINIDIRTNADAAARLRITRSILTDLGLLEGA